MTISRDGVFVPPTVPPGPAPAAPRRRDSTWQRSLSFGDVRTVLRALDAAMRAEGVDRDVRQRIANRLIWDGPEGVSD